jgi:hypothetical protein
MRTSAFLYGALLAIAATPAPAQNASPPQSDDEIIVEGTANRQKQIDSFVRQLTPAPTGTQLGKFLIPICPRVIGLPDAQGRLVETRMRKVAAAIGAPVDSAKCEINLYVMVGGNKREIIEGIRNQFPGLVADVPGSLLRRLEAAQGPVAAWQVIGRIGADGRPLVSMRTSADNNSVLVSSTIGGASRIVHVTQPQFLGSVLVIEARALDRVDTRQLADYAVMRTLAPTDTIRRAALPARSIIQLFDSGSSPETAPMSVTPWDFAFLKALYASPNELAASQQRGEMGRRMAKDLATAPPRR